MSTQMTGYDAEDRYYATRYKQGRRTVYSIELSLANVASTMPKPDPHKLTEDNRRINDSHARSFGSYVRDKGDWVAPALLLRASDIFKFKPEKEVAGIEFGVLSVPRLARADLRILDGQHRILGLHYAVEGLADELAKKRALLSEAKREGTAELIRRYEGEVKKLEDQRKRLDSERVSVQIYVEDESKAYKQMFVDIAENALGITSTIRARFDQRKVVNRALDSVLEHDLLKGRVDLQQDRIGGGNPSLMGAKHVADMVRTVAVGISGRISRRQEGELKEAELAERTHEFLNVLVSGFPALSDLIEGRTTPEKLRKTSLLGSTTMLRVLTGVYHRLIDDKTEEQIGDFFAKLAPYMSAPIQNGSPWLSVPGDIFSEGTSAPKARYQDMETLTNTIVGWSRSEPQWLKVA